MTNKLPTPRTDPNSRASKYVDFLLQEEQRAELEDKIQSFLDLQNNFSTRLKEVMDSLNVIIVQNNIFLLYRVNIDAGIPNLQFSIKIFDDLRLVVTYNGFVWEDAFIRDLFRSSPQCNSWSNLVKFIAHLKNVETCQSGDLHDVQVYVQKSVDLLNSITYDENQLDSCTFGKISFLREQLSLVFKKKICYSPHMLIWAFTIDFSHPGAYQCIRNSNSLTLPHSRYLKKLAMKLGTEKTCLDESHKIYLRNKLAHLESHEPVVNLLLYEVYVQSKIAYTGEKLEGHAYNNPKEPATAIQTFMITSLLSKNEDVVGLFPMKNIQAVQLPFFERYKL